MIIRAERVANPKKPPQSPVNEPGSTSRITNIERINIANSDPVAAPEKITCFDLELRPPLDKI